MANEKRLIDAISLREQMAANFQQALWLGCDDPIYSVAAETIEDAPTVDAVEVVRCKNCAFYREAEDWDGNKYYACHKRAAVLIMQMKPDDFCSYGERRTDD